MFVSLGDPDSNTVSSTAFYPIIVNSKMNTGGFDAFAHPHDEKENSSKRSSRNVVNSISKKDGTLLMLERPHKKRSSSSSSTTPHKMAPTTKQANKQHRHNGSRAEWNTDGRYGYHVENALQGGINIEQFSYRVEGSLGHEETAPPPEGGGVFMTIPASVMLEIYAFAGNRRALLSTCKTLKHFGYKSNVVAIVAAQQTMDARSTADQARLIVDRARTAVMEPNAEVIDYVDGRYTGERKRGGGKKLGVYKANGTAHHEFCGQYMGIHEHGLGMMVYKNKDCYFGDFKKGQRHGHGVCKYKDAWNTACSYEGSWKNNQRSGVGLCIGGAYSEFRFLIGQYMHDKPVGFHWAFDCNKKTCLLLDMDRK